MIVGTEWLVDANGCRPEALRNLELLQTIFQRVITELNLQVVGEVTWHRFPSPAVWRRAPNRYRRRMQTGEAPDRLPRKFAFQESDDS